MNTPTSNPSPTPQVSSPSPQGHPTSNGSAPASSRLPRAKPASFLRRRWGILLLGGLLLGGVGVLFLLSAGRAQTYDGPTAAVKRKRLQVTVVERGTLESAKNSDVVCQVRATQKGTSVATTIKWVIPDGSLVEADQKIVELDDSALQEQWRDQFSKCAEAEAAFTAKKQNLAITLSQNFSDLEKAKTDKVLAEIELRKYVGEIDARNLAKIQDREQLQAYLKKILDRGELEEEKLSLINPLDRSVSEYLRSANEIEGKIKVARADKDMWVDRAAWSERMAKRGLLMKSQAEADRFRLESASITLNNVQAELDILRKFNLEKEVTDRWSKVLEAERALTRVETQNMARETLDRAEVTAKEAVFLQEDNKLKLIEKDIRHCTIYAPQEGMVVYFVPESSRFGTSSNQNLIQEGEPVREGQKLMRIPNLHKMQVNTRVHEAMVLKIKGEQFESTGFSDGARAGMVIGMPDFGGIAGAYQYNLEARNDYREYEQVKVFDGHRASVRVDAFPSNEYHGFVKSVATVASQTDFLSSDVKVYQTIVAIESAVNRLKPGMSAEVVITADETAEEVLTVPIQAVVGTITMGATRKCFVIDEGGRPHEREIKIGKSNDKELEVLEGLSEGDKVALNPRVILGEKSDMKAASPGKSRGFGGGGGGDKGGMKKTGAGGAPGTGAPGTGGPGVTPEKGPGVGPADVPSRKK